MIQQDVLNANEQLIDQWLDALFSEDGLSRATLASYRFDLMKLSQQTAAHLLALTGDQAQSVVGALNQRYERRTVLRFISSAKRFYLYWHRLKRIELSPFSDVDAPLRPRTLPKSISVSAIQRLLSAPDLSDLYEQRDRVMLELMYACGLRVSELITLQHHEILWSSAALRCVGKGSKERVVPMALSTLQGLERYCQETRPQFSNANHSRVVFLSRLGEGMSRQSFWQRVKRYAQRSGLSSSFSPHSLRHAFATHLVDNNADLRVVQLLLGHSSLSTTQIYSHVAQARLQQLHAQHHPRG